MLGTLGYAFPWLVVGVAEDEGGGGELAAPVLAEVSHNSSRVVLAWGSATGGVPPYSYQLHRSLAGAEDYAAVDGATSSPATDATVDPETAYDYAVVVTDDNSDTATSNVVTVTTSALPVAGDSASPRWNVGRRVRISNGPLIISPSRRGH